MPGSHDAIFDWKALPDWCETVFGFIPSDIQAEVQKRVRESPERFKYRDDTFEFEKLYDDIDTFDLLINLFADKFPLYFPFLRMYHCCRPVDLASYYESGLLVLDLSVANRAFSDLYLDNPKFPKITEADLAASVASMAASDGREGRIYFGLDDRFLVHYCSHYLKYGSEYQQGIAVKLGELTGYDIKTDLVQRGRPTVFCVRIPVERIDRDLLRELGRNSFYAWAYGLARGKTETWEVDFAIDTDMPLSPESIIEHYFPTGIS